MRSLNPPPARRRNPSCEMQAASRRAQFRPPSRVSTTPRSVSAYSTKVRPRRDRRARAHIRARGSQLILSRVVDPARGIAEPSHRGSSYANCRAVTTGLFSYPSGTGCFHAYCYEWAHVDGSGLAACFTRLIGERLLRSFCREFITGYHAIGLIKPQGWLARRSASACCGRACVLPASAKAAGEQRVALHPVHLHKSISHSR